MRLVLLGPPAAGKGTQGNLLSEKYGIPHISTGSMFRASMRMESEVGRVARQCIERGELVPDFVTVEIVKTRISRPDCRMGFVLDGFPRTVLQAKSLDIALRELQMRLDAVVNIQIPAGESISRIANRRVCSQCGRDAHSADSSSCKECGGLLAQRPDDTPETARNRLAVYMAQTGPVADYYGRQGCLVTVDGMQSVEKVFACITEQLPHTGETSEAKPEAR